MNTNELIDELAELTDDFVVTTTEHCRGLKEDHASADYEDGRIRLQLTGPLWLVVAVIKAAQEEKCSI